MSGPVGLAGDQLRAFVERIEHVEEEIKALTEDKKDIYAEAKGQGYDVKILREVVGSGSRTRRSRTRTSRCSTAICAPSRQQRRPWRKRREARAGGRLRPPFFVSAKCLSPYLEPMRSRRLVTALKSPTTSTRNRPVLDSELEGPP
jgi:uncharacterized protein (UPF0335 family)